MGTKILRCFALTLIAYSLMISPSFAEPTLEPVRDISGEQVTNRQLEAAIASRTLTWLTGSSMNNDYISVGRIANFFGFVGLRVASGHSLSRSDVAFDTLAVLDDEQRQQLIDLTGDLSDTLKQTQLARQSMNRALESLLVGDAVSRETFEQLAQEYAAGEAKLGGIIAGRFREVASTLQPDQRDALGSIRALHISGQGHLVDLKKPKIKLPKDEKKELVNTAARFLSWTTGSADFNDFEVVGKPSQHFGFVSLRIDTNHGVKRGGIAREVEQILIPQQWALIEQAAEFNAGQFIKFLAARSNLMRYLETALIGAEVDIDRVAVLGRAVGATEAEMTWSQAQVMLEIRNSLSDQQVRDLLALRTKYTLMDESTYSADQLVRGKQLYAQCALCHNASSNYAIAPNLEGVVGRPIGSDAKFATYSPAFVDLANSGDTWTDAFLDTFLASPQSAVPGTMMAFSGLENSTDRDAIIAYLDSLD